MKMKVISMLRQLFYKIYNVEREFTHDALSLQVLQIQHSLIDSSNAVMAAAYLPMRSCHQLEKMLHRVTEDTV